MVSVVCYFNFEGRTKLERVTGNFRCIRSWIGRKLEAKLSEQRNTHFSNFTQEFQVRGSCLVCEKLHVFCFCVLVLLN